MRMADSNELPFVTGAPRAEQSGRGPAVKPQVLQAFLDAATDGVFLLDLAGRFTYVNRATSDRIAAALDLAIPSAAIIGRTSRELGLSEEFARQFEAHLAR